MQGNRDLALPGLHHIQNYPHTPILTRSREIQVTLLRVTLHIRGVSPVPLPALPGLTSSTLTIIIVSSCLTSSHPFPLHLLDCSVSCGLDEMSVAAAAAAVMDGWKRHEKLTTGCLVVYSSWKATRGEEAVGREMGLSVDDGAAVVAAAPVVVVVAAVAAAAYDHVAGTVDAVVGVDADATDADAVDPAVN
jgi:hypothetical protein